jgi:hypothetical protein
MTEEEAREFVEDLGGFSGEVTWRVENPDPEGHGMSITGFPLYDDEMFDERFGKDCHCPEGRQEPCPHDLRDGLDTKNEMLVIELFAESIWGRSHRSVGKLHKVKYTDCQRTHLADPNDMPEELKDKIYEVLF